MTEQGLAVVRRAFVAFNRWDVEGLLALCHHDIEWIPLRAPEGRVYRGHAGVRAALEELAQEFEEVRNDPRDLRIAGEAVVVGGRLVAKYRGTGVRVDRSAGWVCHVREGRLARMEVFPDGAAARRAAGAA